MNISSNVSSLQANQLFMNNDANNITNVNTNSFVPTNTTITNNGNSVTAQSQLADNTGSSKSQTDLAKEIPDQITIDGVAKANVTAIKAQDDIMGTLLDLKA
jgi:flagellar hook protein FlgE